MTTIVLPRATLFWWSRRSLALAALVLALAPSAALATIVIGNPIPAYGDAWGPGNVPVTHMNAPIAGWVPFHCNGTPAAFTPVHQVIDLVRPQGFALPAGTWCRIDAVLEGDVIVEVDGDEVSVDAAVIHLLGQASITNFKLEITGASGGLVANVDDD